MNGWTTSRFVTRHGMNSNTSSYELPPPPPRHGGMFGFKMNKRDQQSWYVSVFISRFLLNILRVSSKQQCVVKNNGHFHTWIRTCFSIHFAWQYWFFYVNAKYTLGWMSCFDTRIGGARTGFLRHIAVLKRMFWLCRRMCMTSIMSIGDSTIILTARDVELTLNKCDCMENILCIVLYTSGK